VAAIVEWRFVMMSKSLVSRLGAPLVVLILTFAPIISAVGAAENLRKGDRGVIRSLR
jgi:hypothetical protein